MIENATCCTCGKEGINPDRHRCIPELKKELNEWQRQVCGQGEVISLLNDKLFAANATIASLTRELDKAKEGLAAAIIHAGLATGHGDTVDDLLQELREQVARLTQELEEARRWVNDLQSGMYINCVYCGHRYGPKDKVPCTMADALKQHIEQCPKHPMSSLRAELADLRLTAAHMDGFASGKAEATEMLRKREGQLEELRAEVKAYREVEDSLQKEIKRLDEEVASLTQELEEARSMIQWERGAKNGAYELIEQQDKLKAENAALREEVEQLKSRLDVRYNDTDPPTFFDDAISRLETDNKRLREEVARISESDEAIFNALNGNVCDPNPVKPIWPNPACFTPTTYGLAVGLLRERDALRSRLAAAEKELAEGLTAAHMDGFAPGKAEAKEMLRKRDGQLEELRAKLEQAERELAAERERVEMARNCVSEAMETYTNLQDDHPYFVDVFDKLHEILK